MSLAELNQPLLARGIDMPIVLLSELNARDIPELNLGNLASRDVVEDESGIPLTFVRRGQATDDVLAELHRRMSGKPPKPPHKDTRDKETGIKFGQHSEAGGSTAPGFSNEAIRKALADRKRKEEETRKKKEEAEGGSSAGGKRSFADLVDALERRSPAPPKPEHGHGDDKDDEHGRDKQTGIKYGPDHAKSDEIREGHRRYRQKKEQEEKEKNRGGGHSGHSGHSEHKRALDDLLSGGAEETQDLLARSWTWSADDEADVAALLARRSAVGADDGEGAFLVLNPRGESINNAKGWAAHWYCEANPLICKGYNKVKSGYNKVATVAKEGIHIPPPPPPTNV